MILLPTLNVPLFKTNRDFDWLIENFEFPRMPNKNRKFTRRYVTEDMLNIYCKMISYKYFIDCIYA